VFPLVPGHVLVVPKNEIDFIFYAPDELLKEWLLFAKPIAQAIQKAFPCNRVGLSVIGLEVPHAHMHLLPINQADDINFTREKLKPTASELEESQRLILLHLVHSDL
jgi:histidine triad (HIT) family protein